MKGDRKKSLVSYEKIVGKKFRKKYEYDNNIFCRQIITQIIYNQKSRIVSAFKDNLIINDPTEFLKRYYTKRESKVRLKKYFDYYEEFSKIYPNYTAIHEGKYFYLNIQRKQRLIDIQEELEYKSRINRKEQRMNKFKFFNTDVYDSIVNDPDKEEIEFLFDIEVDMTKSEREKEENENTWQYGGGLHPAGICGLLLSGAGAGHPGRGGHDLVAPDIRTGLGRLLDGVADPAEQAGRAYRVRRQLLYSDHLCPGGNWVLLIIRGNALALGLPVCFRRLRLSGRSSGIPLDLVAGGCGHDRSWRADFAEIPGIFTEKARKVHCLRRLGGGNPDAFRSSLRRIPGGPAHPLLRLGFW